MTIRKAEEKDILRIIELLGQVLQILSLIHISEPTRP